MLSPLFVVPFVTMVDQLLDSDYSWLQGSQQFLQKSWVQRQASDVLKLEFPFCDEIELLQLRNSHL